MLCSPQSERSSPNEEFSAGVRAVQERIKKWLRKTAKKGFRGYPIATIAHYGPDNRKATKVVVSIVASEDASPEPMKKWFSEEDVRNDEQILAEIKEFISINGATSVAMLDRIIGCPQLSDRFSRPISYAGATVNGRSSVALRAGNAVRERRERMHRL